MARFTGAGGGSGIPGPAGADGADGTNGLGYRVVSTDFKAITPSDVNTTIPFTSYDNSAYLEGDLVKIYAYSFGNPTGVEILGVIETVTSDESISPVLYTYNVYVQSLVSNGDASTWIFSLRGETGPAGDIGIETSYAVQGGTDGDQPTFTGAPLFTASYIRMSNDLVHFQIQVDMDNITSFGTGQYYMTLPFDAKYPYIFRDGCVHDFSTGQQYHISGHVAADSNIMILASSAKDGNHVEDVAFSPDAPIALATDDNFHIAGTYIAQEIGS